MPVVDAFPTRLREELEAAYEEDLDEVFDVAAVRNALDLRLKSLESELHQVCSAGKVACQMAIHLSFGAMLLPCTPDTAADAVASVVQLKRMAMLRLLWAAHCQDTIAVMDA